MGSIFSKIVAGEIPCYKVAEDTDHLAFLDINPNAQGHTLCIPKKETDRILDLSQAEYTALLEFSRKVGLALRKVVTCKRIGMQIIGLEVPHVHVHLIPLNKIEDASFQSKVALDSESLEAIASKIKAAYSEVRSS